MADRTRLAAAGFFLALALAAVPALLPVRLAGAANTQQGEIRTAARPETTRPLVRLRSGHLAARPASEPVLVPEGVLQAAIAQATPRSHSVESGETLWKISSDAGISVQALAVANHLFLGATLHPGQVLTIPRFDPASARMPQSTHEVAAGETLWGISRTSGVPVESLAAANHLSLDAVLHPGQMLVVPAGEGAAASLAGEQARHRARPGSEGPGAHVTSALRSLAAGVRWLEQPSEGLITSWFGWRTHPIFGTREFHTGIDIANRMGTPIRAAETGVVRFVGWLGGYGRLVILAHSDGFETSYSHLSSMLVSLGQRVVRGEMLGRMGSTGWSTGPHLFFEVRRNGVALDPMPFLRGRQGIPIQAADAEAVPARPAGHPSVQPSTNPAADAPPAVSAAPPAADGPTVTPPITHRRPVTEPSTEAATEPEPVLPPLASVR